MNHSLRPQNDVFMVFVLVGFGARPDALGEQRPRGHLPAVHGRAGSLPGGPDIRVHGEPQLPAALDQESHQLRGGVDQACGRPQDTDQVSLRYATCWLNVTSARDVMFTTLTESNKLSSVSN